MPGVLARSPLAQAALVVIVAALVYLPFLGVKPLDFSEGHRAVPGWTMLESHDFWHVRMFGLTYLRKPPGMPWAIAASSSFFGETPFAARLPSAIAAILMSIIAFWYGRRWFGAGGGLAAGLAQALMPLMWQPGRTAEIEMLNNFGTQLAAMGLIDLSLNQRAPSASSGGLVATLRASIVGATTHLLPLAGLIIAALAKGPASVPVLGGVLIGTCIAARSLRPLARPALWVAFSVGAGLIAILAVKILAANSDPDAVHEDVAGQFLWSPGRLLGVLTLAPLAFASAFPHALALLAPFGASNARADERRTARALAWAWLASIAILVACGMSNPRYAMPAAVLLPPLVAYAFTLMQVPTSESSGTLLRFLRLLSLGGPSRWAAVMLMGAWWFQVLTSVSPTDDQLAGPKAAAAFAALAPQGQLWADEAIEARPDLLWIIHRDSSALVIRWAKSDIAAGHLPPIGSFLLLTGPEARRYDDTNPSGRLLRLERQVVRKHEFSLFQVRAMTP